MQELIYIIQALNVFYRSAHWRSKGVNFYQDHLLFERLYSKLDDEVDSLVELLIATSGDDSFASPQLFNQRVQRYIPVGKATAQENLQSALQTETELLAAIQAINESEAQAGIYNQIATIADNHTRNLYLIKQALK
jgi:DNA-binding ferritin-like protein